MKDIMDAAQAFIEQSKTMHRKSPRSKREVDKWTDCVTLLKSGWKNITCYDADESTAEYEDEVNAGSSDIIFVWQKESDIKNIRLSFKQQLLWVEYLEHNQGE